MLRVQPRALVTAMAIAAAATGVAACGSSGSGGSGANTSAAGGSAASGSPVTLLKQAFSSSQSVKSGRVSVRIVITPTGSSIITTPITLAISGPYEQAQKGQTPQSDISISFSGLGKHASFGVITTKEAGYITLQGTAYKLPAADFKQISRATSGSSTTGGVPGLSALGIDPARWLKDPQIVGTEQVDGTETEHVSSTVDVSKVIGDLNTLLAKESSTLHLPAGTDHISPGTAQKLAAAIKHPTIDMWIGKRDSILRRMQLGASVPVSGTASTQLGGLTSAAFKVTVNVSDVNQPQTIAPPAHARSYRALQTKLQGILSGLGGLGALGTTTSSGGGTASPAPGSTKRLNKYSKCLDNARGDVTKMQKCQRLLNG